jgi:hypothetical protein
MDRVELNRLAGGAFQPRRGRLLVDSATPSMARGQPLARAGCASSSAACGRSSCSTAPLELDYGDKIQGAGYMVDKNKHVTDLRLFEVAFPATRSISEKPSGSAIRVKHHPPIDCSLVARWAPLTPSRRHPGLLLPAGPTRTGSCARWHRKGSGLGMGSRGFWRISLQSSLNGLSGDGRE